MLTEIGRIVAVESDSLWVETIQRSACGSCQAQKGCGHSMLAKWGATASRLRVLLEGRNPSDYQLGGEVKIGVPEELIANGSLFIYIVPLLMMLITTFLAHQQGLGEGVSVVAALAGLVTGAFVVRWRSHQMRFDKRWQPILIDEQKNLQAIPVCTLE